MMTMKGALGTAALCLAVAACGSAATSTVIVHARQTAPPSPPAQLVRACGEMVTWFNLNDPTQETIYATRAALDAKGTRLATEFIRLVNISQNPKAARAKVMTDARAVWADCARYGVRGPWSGVMYPPGPSLS